MVEFIQQCTVVRNKTNRNDMNNNITNVPEVLCAADISSIKILYYLTDAQIYNSWIQLELL